MFRFIREEIFGQYGALINLVIQAVLASAVAYFVVLIVQGVISWRNSDSSADLKKAIGSVRRSIIGLLVIVVVYLFYIFALTPILIG
jgi:hypothetical protein